MPTAPTPLTSPPETPDRADRATFSSRAVALDEFRKTTERTEKNALATNVYNNAVEAAAGAATMASAAVTTAADRVQTAADRVQTGLDRVATAADRVQTGLDRVAAASSAAEAAASAASLHGTSTTSLLIAVASRVFTTQANEAYTSGVWITATSAANIANWMYGQVVSYAGTTLTVNVQVVGGSGTYADWNLSISAARGAQGEPGTVNATNMASVAHAATDKSTPADADEFSLIDSAASWVLKKLTWANLKATFVATFVATANTFTKPQKAGTLALTHNTAWDGTAAQHLTAAVNGSSFTIANPSAHTDGVVYLVRVAYITSHSITWGGNFKGLTGIVATAAAGAEDIFSFRSNGTNLVRVGYSLNGAA